MEGHRLYNFTEEIISSCSTTKLVACVAAEPLPFASQVWWWFMQEILTKAASVSAQLVCNAQCKILQVLPKKFPCAPGVHLRPAKEQCSPDQQQSTLARSWQCSEAENPFQGKMHLHLGSCLSWTPVKSRASGGWFIFIHAVNGWSIPEDDN